MAPQRIILATFFILSSSCFAHDVNGLKSHFEGYDVKTNAEIAKRRGEIRLQDRPGSPDEAIYLADAKWPDGATLRLCFFGGTNEIRLSVSEIAIYLFAQAGLTLDSGAENAPRSCDPSVFNEIRITFNTSGTWAQIGRDALVIPRHLPTVGLEGFDKKNELTTLDRSTITHEFFHVLGALHEHQHPDASCYEELDVEEVKKYTGWSDADINFNLKRIADLSYFEGKNIVKGNYDPKSIMHYALPLGLFRDASTAKCFVSQPIQPSDEDIAFLRTLYGQR